MADELQCIFPFLSKELVEDVLRLSDENVELAAEQLFQLAQSQPTGREDGDRQDPAEKQGDQSRGQLWDDHTSFPPGTHHDDMGAYTDMHHDGPCGDEQPPMRSDDGVDEAGMESAHHLGHAIPRQSYSWTLTEASLSGDKGQDTGTTQDYYRMGLGNDVSHKRVMVVVRGLPGSGKTTLAETLVGSTGVICSTDDYFMTRGRYIFDPSKLEHSHEQNRLRVQNALEMGYSPVIVDNTNTTVKEMKPYFKLAKQYGYLVQLKEPETGWKFDVEELARRNIHGVSSDTLQKMLQRYEHGVNVENIMKKLKCTPRVSIPGKAVWDPVPLQPLQPMGPSYWPGGGLSTVGGVAEDEIVDGLSTGKQEDHTPHYSPLVSSQRAPAFATSYDPPPDGWSQDPAQHADVPGDSYHRPREPWQQLDAPTDGLLDDGDRAQVDLDFLQSATNLDQGYLKQLYLKCGCDLERTIDVALAHPLDDTSDYGSEERHACSGSDPEMDGNGESEYAYASSQTLTEEGTRPAMEVPEDGNLVLRLSATLAAHLQQLFGDIDKTLFSDDEDDFLVLLSENAAHQIYTKWVDTLEARRIERQFRSDQKGALQSHANSHAKSKRARRNKFVHTKMNRGHSVPMEPLQIRVVGQPSFMELQDEEVARELQEMEATALVKERSEGSRGFQLQLQQLYEQFQAVDKGTINLTLYENGYNFDTTIGSLESRFARHNTPKVKRRSLLKTKPALHLPDDHRIEEQCIAYQEMRAEAAIQAKLRSEAFQKAAHAKRSREDALAGYYAQEGHMCTTRMKRANQEAANILLKIQQRPNTLDLHGFYVNEALKALQEVLQVTPKGSHLVVVTGRGIHSVNNTARVKPAVISYLRQHGYRTGTLSTPNVTI